MFRNFSTTNLPSMPMSFSLAPVAGNNTFMYTDQSSYKASLQEDKHKLNIGGLGNDVAVLGVNNTMANPFPH